MPPVAAAGRLRKICKQIREILDSSDKPPANRPGMVSAMAKIIPVSFAPSRLPRRLLRDGWWLESPPARRAVVPFTKTPPELDVPPPSEPGAKAPRLTLVHSRN